MKSYIWKLAIAFIISYALLVLVVVFSYTLISNNFIINQAKSNLVQKGDVVAERINTQLSYDYQKVTELIEQAELTQADPVLYLHGQAQTITVLDDTYQGFGTLDDRTVTFGLESYTYHTSFSLMDISQPVAIYSFQEAFQTGTDEKYVFFFNR